MGTTWLVRGVVGLVMHRMQQHASSSAGAKSHLIACWVGTRRKKLEHKNTPGVGYPILAPES